MRTKLFLLLCLIPASLFAKCHKTSCSRFQLPGWWGSADYLLLWRRERYYPPLVTTNPTALPVLSDSNTSILFGDKYVGGNPKSGGRVDIGFWMTKCLGFGTSWFALSKESVDYHIEGNALGEPIFGRPFFNTSTGADSVDPISYGPDNLVYGRVDVDTTNHLWGYDFYARYRFLCSKRFKFDFLGGFLYSRIDDDLDIMTKTDDTGLIPPSVIEVSDHFNCKNDYYAGLVGIMAEWRTGCWAICLSGKLGLGNMVKTVKISGMTKTTVLDPLGPTITVEDFGLLAQPSNRGNHSSNQFELIPQLSAKLQLKVLPHVWLSAGYTYMFWRAVVLAGEQVDLNVNLTQNLGPPVGPLAPLFNRKDTGFWVQGLTAGIYVLY